MCARAHALRLELSLRRLSKTDQNATFTFVTLKGKKKKKKLPLSETLSSVRFFFLSIFKAGTVNSSSFDRLPLKFYKHSLTKRIMEDILQSTKYIQTAVT